jgi:cytochrome c nitrite reductase small subunit
MPESLTRLLGRVYPPPQWKMPVILTLGVLTGVVFVVLYISNAWSYLSDDPTACMNCHIMAPQYATWEKGSHGRVTNCNDCHVPHNNFVRKYLFKASDGLRHASIFTFRLEPDVIRVKSAGIGVIQENCIRCHIRLIECNSLVTVTLETVNHGDGKLCWDCHRETPHGRMSSLAEVPYARVPIPSPITPPWMGRIITSQSLNFTKSGK